MALLSQSAPIGPFVLAPAQPGRRIGAYPRSEDNAEVAPAAHVGVRHRVVHRHNLTAKVDLTEWAGQTRARVLAKFIHLTRGAAEAKLPIAAVECRLQPEVCSIASTEFLAAQQPPLATVDASVFVTKNLCGCWKRPG